MVTTSSDAVHSQIGWPEFSDPTLVPRILEVIAVEGMIDRTAIRPDSTLETLGVDSIEVVMIVNGLEDAFEITIPNDLRLGDAANLTELVGMLGMAIVRDRAGSRA